MFKKKKISFFGINSVCGNCGTKFYVSLKEHIEERERFYEVHPESDFSTAVPICDQCVRRMQRRLNKELRRIDKEARANVK